MTTATAIDIERHDLPNLTVWYSDPDHAYYAHSERTGRKGRRMAGVTTVVKPFSWKPDGLMKWAAKTNLVGVAELYAMAGDGDWLDSGDTIWAELQRMNLTYNDVKMRAAKRGTNAHEQVLEKLARGEEVELGGLTDEEAGHASAILDFWQDHNPQPILSEQVVGCNDLMVAGRLDLFTTLDSLDGFGVVDLKTGFVAEAAHVQAAGYLHLLRKSGLIVPTTTNGVPDESNYWTAILKTTADGEYQLIMGQATEDDFLDAVRVYRRASKLHNREQVERG